FGEAFLNLVGNADHVDFDAPTGRAGDEGDAAIAQFERAQDFIGDGNLFLRLRAQADANGVADATGKQQAEAHRGLDRARHQRPGFGNAEVQRIIRAFGEAAIGFNGSQGRGRFQRDLDFVEVQCFAPTDVFQRLCHHALRQVFALFATRFRRVAALQHAVVAQAHLDALHLPALVKRIDGTGVDADTHGDAAFLAGFDNLFQRLTPVDEVAGVDTHAVNALANGFQSQGVFIMNIGNQRDMDALLNLANRPRVLHLWYSHAHYLTANVFEAQDLRDRAIYIACISSSHRLHGDRCIAANRYIANMNLPGFPSHNVIAPLYKTR